MKSIEFVYWLQGCFEMGDVASFNEEQFSTIEKHLKMVEIVEAKQQLPFCFWLRGIMEIQESKNLDVRVTKIVKDKLNSIFQHVVEQKEDLSSKHTAAHSVAINC